MDAKKEHRSIKGIEKRIEFVYVKKSSYLCGDC